MNILNKRRQSIFGNKKLMVKSGRFHAHQWYLIFLLKVKRKMRREVAPSNMSMCYDIAECFFWLPFFFPEKSQLPGFSHCTLQSFAPHSKIQAITVRDSGFCDLAFTFCPSAAGLHHQKQTLMGCPYPVLEPTWQLHSQAIWAHVYFWMSCGPPSVRNRSDQTGLDQVGSFNSWVAWLSYQDSTAHVVCIGLCPNICLRVTRFFEKKNRLHNSNQKYYLRRTQYIM